MGGHGHGHKEPFKVPPHTNFPSYKHCPHLVQHADRLARLGLKDPWIRSYIWMFDPKANVTSITPGKFFIQLLRPGFLPGLAIAAGIIAIDEGYAFLKHGHTSWGAEH